MIKALLTGTAETPVVVQAESAMNSSAEVQRLAGCLWASHPHTVTAYCLRHQCGADAKRNGDADASAGDLATYPETLRGSTAPHHKANRHKG
jgi:hypothetical protein